MSIDKVNRCICDEWRHAEHVEEDELVEAVGDEAMSRHVHGQVGRACVIAAQVGAVEEGDSFAPPVEHEIHIALLFVVVRRQWWQEEVGHRWLATTTTTTRAAIMY